MQMTAYIFAIKQLLTMTAIAWMIALVGGCDKNTPDTERGVGLVIDAPNETALQASDFGTYHALIIGINEYDIWPKLKYALGDAADIRSLLTQHYSFKPEHVTFLNDDQATRSTIIQTLRNLLLTLNETDNLLIYYAGHGQLDPLTDDGYWIPVEGAILDESTWIPFSTLTKLLTAVNAKVKNVLIITDSCFGGALASRGGPPAPGTPSPDLKTNEYIQTLREAVAKPSREVMVSGGFEQVPDQSLFAELLKSALDTNQHPYLDAELLFYTRIYGIMRSQMPDQDPTMVKLVADKENSGRFVFVRNDNPLGTHSSIGLDTVTTMPSASSESQSSITLQGDIVVRSNVVDDKVYVDETFVGSTRLDLRLPIGSHMIKIKKSGYITQEERIELAENKTLTLNFSLQPIEIPEPQIVSFKASPLTSSPGEEVILSWETTHATNVKLNGESTSLAGAIVTKPEKTTAYTLTAENAQGKITRAQTHIQVKQLPASIISFTSSKYEINTGDSITLAWHTENASTVTIPGISDTLENNGSMTLNPKISREYTLQVTSNNAPAGSSTLRISVIHPQPQISAFHATSTTITAGSSVKLSWKANNAHTILLNDEPVAMQGTESVRPRATTTYTLIASNEQGYKDEKRIKVSVTTQPLPENVRVIKPVTLDRNMRLATVANIIVASGTQKIKQTYLADFDSTPRESHRSLEVDIQFSAQTATSRMIKPLNGAALNHQLTRKAPTLKDCKAKTYSRRSLDVNRLSKGSYLCIKTSSGHYSIVQILDPPGTSPGVLTVKYTTWK